MFTPTLTPLPRFEFAVHDADMAEMLAERAHMEATLDAQIAEADEATFEAQMQSFETQIEDEEIAALIQAARELAIEEAATDTLRRQWEMGLAA